MCYWAKCSLLLAAAIVAGQALGQDALPGQSGSMGKRLLYLTSLGNRDQLRLRAFPYPGSERIVWASPEPEKGSRRATRIAWYVPSPSSARVAIVEEDSVRIIRLGDSKTESVVHAPGVCYASWRDDDHLSLLTYDHEEWQEWTCNRNVGKPELVRSGTSPNDFFGSSCSTSVGLLRDLANGHGVAVPFSADEAAEVTARAAGFHLTTPGQPYGPMAAVSPDGEWIALTTGLDAVVVASLLVDRWAIRDVIPLTRLLSHEMVWVKDLRWSADSADLTFTEVHYHPPKDYPADFGGRPDPLDWTYLVRIYSAKNSQVDTLVVGRNAVVIPSDKPG